MKNRIASGAAAIVFGLLIALGPQFLFKVCPVAGDVIMKCHWSARAEIGIGALIAVLGAALVFFADPRTRLGITLAIFLTAVLALLIPHALIGGCAMPFMPCRKITFPALTVISILLLVGAAGNLAYLARLIRKKHGIR
jgi:hypothetical protein